MAEGCSIEDLIKQNNQISFIQTPNISIDMKQLTQWLNVEEIGIICLQSLNSEIDISQANVNFIENICSSKQ